MIEIKNLGKKYYVTEIKGNAGYISHLFNRKYKKEVEALKEIQLSIGSGETVGLIGHNGAGKSTLIKIMTGILKETTGEIEVLGKYPFDNRLVNNKKIASVFGQKTQLRWDISPYESYKIIAAMYEVPWLVAKKRIQELSDMLDMEEILHIPVRNLSLGQKMKAELLATFLYTPEIIFLDEPTIGLDIFTKEKILEFISSMKGKATIIFTSHDLRDIAKVCDRVVVLKKGQLIFDQPMAEIVQFLPEEKNVEIIFEEKPENAEQLFAPYIFEIEEVNKIKFTKIYVDEFTEILKCIEKNKFKIHNINFVEPDFEQIIKKILTNGSEK